MRAGRDSGETFVVEGESIRRLGSTEFVVWRSHGLPGALDALIVPEDTYLCLQAVTEKLDPNATPLDLWAAGERAARVEKHALGSVVITDGKRKGVKYIASVIVCDFEAETICHKEVVRVGLYDALSELAAHDCKTIGVLPLGTMQGGISEEEYFAALDVIVRDAGGEPPRTLYLLGQDWAPREETDA